MIIVITFSFKVIQYFLQLFEELSSQLSFGFEKSIEIRITSIKHSIIHTIQRIKDIVENIVPAFWNVDFISSLYLQNLIIITKIRQIKLNNNINRKIIKLEIDIFFQTIIMKQHSTKIRAIA